MRIDFHGNPIEQRQMRAGFIGCGSHSFRNLYPALQFTPVELVAVCDLNIEKAGAFASAFGAASAYSDYREMLESEDLEAVFVCVGYDAETGRPLYPPIAVDCIAAGCHVWMEKPPAASTDEVAWMQDAASKADRNAQVGFKKMFFPANVKALELMQTDDFGSPELAMLQYPQYIPTQQEFREYIAARRTSPALGFLDHMCHPVSILLLLLGMPRSMRYERSSNGAGVATFGFHSGAVGTIAFTCGASINNGMERTTIVSNNSRHITVENNIRVSYHRLPPVGYGNQPNFFAGNTGETSALWEPEFSLGQLYNKGLFLLGYYDEINEFARSVLEERPPSKGTLKHAMQITRIFEAFAAGPGIETSLAGDLPGAASRE